MRAVMGHGSWDMGGGMLSGTVFSRQKNTVWNGAVCEAPTPASLTLCSPSLEIEGGGWGVGVPPLEVHHA